MSAKKKSKKVKRVVLGVGHPWYHGNATGGGYSSVCLTETAVAQSILMRGGEKTLGLKYSGTGNWNKARLVLEILK